MVIQASPFGPVRTEADAIVADRQGQLRRQDVEPDGHGMGLGMTGSLSGIAHFAHLGGLVGGWLVIRYWRGQSPFGKRRR